MDHGFFGADKTLGFFFSPNEVGLGIQAKNRKDSQTMNLSCFCQDSTGSYLMRHVTPFSDYNRNCTYLLDTLKRRVIMITMIEKEKRILTGTFEFTTYKTGGVCLDTLTISDGKFQLNY